MSLWWHCWPVATQPPPFTTAGAVVVGVLADELRVAPRHGSTAQFVRGAVSAAPAVLRIGMDLRRLATRHGIDVIHSNGYRSPPPFADPGAGGTAHCLEPPRPGAALASSTAGSELPRLG